ncbi:uncharacterized protein G2W53_026631 [Senna tora]|uniref:Uncharacterized protein n=1 Tax=Senna tora TaxID=362788 RepID=A0A834THC6_9FABA|nr:uncharacterized protein G2W53_026631 [Senna tora]
MERPTLRILREQAATPQGTGELSLQARVERLIAQVAEMQVALTSLDPSRRSPNVKALGNARLKVES